MREAIAFLAGRTLFGPPYERKRTETGTRLSGTVEKTRKAIAFVGGSHFV